MSVSYFSSATQSVHVDNTYQAYLSDPENNNTFLQAFASLDQSLTSLEEQTTTPGKSRLATTTCHHFSQGTFASHCPHCFTMTPSLSIPRTRMGGLLCRVPLPYTVPPAFALGGRIGCGVAIKPTCLHVV
jgi:hypothetical protein